MVDQSKCNFNFKKVNRPQSATVVSQDHRFTYVSKRELVAAYIPAVAVCQKLCTSPSLPCPTVESRLLVQITGDGGVFYPSFDLTSEKIEDETTKVALWFSPLSPVNGFEFKDQGNFLIFIAFNDNASATRIEDHILLNCPVSSSDAIVFLTDTKDDIGNGSSLIFILGTGAEDVPSLFSITLGEDFDDDESPKMRVFFGLEGEKIIFGTSNNDGIATAYPTTTTFLSQSIALPGGDNVIMLSYNRSGIVTCMVNNVRFKFRSPLIQKRLKMRVEGVNYCSENIEREIELKEMYWLDTAENKSIRTFYDSLLEKYSLSDYEFGPDLFLFTHTGVDKSITYDWTEYPDDGYPQIYNNCLRNFTANATYVNTNDDADYFGTILESFYNISGESMSLTNITFSGSPASGFTSGLYVVKYYDADAEDEEEGITTNLLQDYPIQIENQLNGETLTYTIASSYSTISSYTGTMTLHIRFRNKAYLIDIPIVHNIT